MRRDVLNDRYGRLYQIPTNLAAAGAQVDAVVASYRFALPSTFSIVEDGVAWRSYILPVSLGSYLMAVDAAAVQADVVVVSSDCFHVALGARLKRRFRKPLVVDLYDNYESFGMAKLPMARKGYTDGIRAADLVCCNGSMLQRHALDIAGSVDTILLRSTVDVGTFSPKPREICRDALGLERNKTYVGLVGGLSAKRGIVPIYNACRNLVEHGADLNLVLAGGQDASWPIPSDAWVKYLGDLPHGRMVDFYNAVDLNVIHARDDEFGRFCFPQKAYEILATKRPLVAAKVGEIAHVLSGFPEVLFDPESRQDIESAIRRQLSSPTRISMEFPNWERATADLYRKVYELTHQRTSTG
jgi:glycosyltransferase involved in cell wall biosynthesis